LNIWNVTYPLEAPYVTTQLDFLLSLASITS
jgi:hypothetical protein